MKGEGWNALPFDIYEVVLYGTSDRRRLLAEHFLVFAMLIGEEKVVVSCFSRNWRNLPFGLHL